MSSVVNRTKYALLAVLLTAFMHARAAFSDTTIYLIPQPAKMIVGSGDFTVNKHTQIRYNDDADSVTANYLIDYIERFFHLKLSKTKQTTGSNNIEIVTKKFIQPPKNAEHYTISSSKEKILIAGDSYAANFLAANTLLQLIKQKNTTGISIPVCEIDDAPRFRYRGMHLDVARHFFDVDFIKKFIDLLALHKFNRFHWHLTDDQGWRIEIKKYPLLTQVGGFRNGTIIGRYPGLGNTGKRYGGFYTQNQIKDIVGFAASRHITIIPEIDMPGHASAAIAAYPALSCFPLEPTPVPFGSYWSGDSSGKQVQQTWGVFEDVFCAGKESTFQFVEDVLSEVIDLFPSEYIHIGGDECPKQHWKKCPNCQATMKAKGIANENELQSYFMQRVNSFLNSRNRKSIAWDEILDGGKTDGITVMNWRSDKAAVKGALNHLNIIRTPESYFYLDFAQSKNEDSVTRGRYVPLESIFAFTPYPAGITDSAKKYIIGVQGNLWTEYMTNPAKVEYQAFPRLSAISEVAWGYTTSYSTFQKKLPRLFNTYRLWNVKYSAAAYEIVDSIYTVQHPKVAVKVKLKNANCSSAVIDGKPLQPLPYTFTITTNKTIEASASCANAMLRYKKTFLFNKATAQKISGTTPASFYPGENGLQGLVNGISANQFNSTEWLGWYGKDVYLQIELAKKEAVSCVQFFVWEQEASFIYLPSEIEIGFSGDGKSWKKYVVKPGTKGWLENKSIRFCLDKPTMAKFMRVRLANSGRVPEGRPSAGSNTWLFLSEIAIQ